MVVKTVQVLSQVYPIYIVSYRSIKSQVATEQWLLRHNIPFSAIRLRIPMGAPKDVAHYKRDVALALRREGMNPILMIDDWPQVRTEMAKIGIPTLLVNPGYTDHTMNVFSTLQTLPGWPQQSE